MLNTLNIPLNQVYSVQLLCETHNDKPIINICVDDTCQQNPLFCADCIPMQQAHINTCQKQVLDCQSALLNLVQNLENIAPQSIFVKYFDYFREFQGKEKEYIDFFQSFIKTQKQKLVDDLEKVKEAFISRFEAFKKEQLEKLDDQVVQYLQNYEILKNLFNDSLGLRYKELIKYSHIKSLTKKINASQDKAADFIKEIKQDYNFFHSQQKDDRLESFSYKLQELFLLLNSQSMSPPTYKSNQFDSEILDQTKYQFDVLVRKLGKSIGKNIDHYPMKNFNTLVGPQEMVQSFKATISIYDFQTEPLQQIGPNNILVPARHKKIERDDTKYVNTSDEDNCVTAMSLLGDRVLAYGLSDFTVRFKQLKEDDLNAEYDFMQMNTWIYSIEVLALSLDDDSEEVFPKIRLGMSFSRAMKKNSNPMFDELSEKIRDVYVLALGGETQIFIWKVFVYDDPSMNQVEIMTVQEFKPTGLFRCMCIMDCQDGRTFICGDWEGQIFIFDMRQQCQLFQLDTQTQIILKFCQLSKFSRALSKSLRFASASRCDMELGGVSIWAIRYDDNRVRDCVMEKRIPISQVVNLLALKQNPQILVIVDQKNKVFVWDIQKNQAIQTFMGGESHVIDFIVLEGVSEIVDLTIGIINSNTLRFIDNETTFAQFQVDDSKCEQCRLYFCSNKVLIHLCHDDQFTLIFPRHIHTCRHDTSTCDTEDRCKLKTCFQFLQLKISQLQ